MTFIILNRTFTEDFEEAETEDILGLSDLEESGIIEDSDLKERIDDYTLISLN